MEVEVLDHENMNHVIWSCASNGKNFLEALFLVTGFLCSKIKNLPGEVENFVVLKLVEKCTTKGGGDKYIEFYKMLRKGS